jgi:hypothetical protein
MGPTLNAGSSTTPENFSSNILDRNRVTLGERAGRQGCDRALRNFQVHQLQQVLQAHTARFQFLDQ